MCNSQHDQLIEVQCNDTNVQLENITWLNEVVQYKTAYICRTQCCSIFYFIVIAKYNLYDNIILLYYYITTIIITILLK